MRNKLIQLIVVFVFATMNSCAKEKEPQIVFETDILAIEQLTPTVFKHISYLQTNDFGKVDCNGMVYISENKALVFDTPTNNSASIELINWIETIKKATIIGVVINHFHEDCLGGLNQFHKQNIPSYSNNLTIELARKDSLEVPKVGFDEALDLKLGSNRVVTRFFGEGHTKDNLVSYVENENVLFGGCMIKSLDASKGYLGNATISEWSKTVEKVKMAFPNVKIVIPGHGKVGDEALLDYTIQLFKE